MSSGPEFSTDVSEPPKSNRYPTHRVEERACDAGEHDLVDGPAPYTRVCKNCGYGLGTLVDILGHNPADRAQTNAYPWLALIAAALGVAILFTAIVGGVL